MTGIVLRLMAIRHIPDMLHGTTMIRTETIKGASIRYPVVGSWILVPGPGRLDLAVGVVVARLPEDT